jgi:hypothetical protein
MQHWASLSPQLRAQAREIFRQIQQLPPEKRREVLQRWEQYDQFPPELKEALRAARGKTP